jgi:O-antigen/teichoic acid export membrane protein
LSVLKLIKSQNIKVSAVGALGIKFFSAFFVFANSILLARLLSLKGYGVYTLAFATTTLLSVPATLGLPMLVIRYISKYEVYSNKAAIKGLLISANTFAWLSSVIIGIGGYISYLLWWKNLNEDLVNTMWYGFLLLPILALGSLRSAALTGIKFVVLGQLPDTLLRNFLSFAGFLICYLFKLPIKPPQAMMIYLIAAGISFLIGHYFLQKKLLYKLKKIKPVFHNKEWLKQALPFSLNSGVQVIKSKLLTYVLAIFGSVESVALFDVATRASSLVAFTLDAFNNAISPYISTAFEKNDRANLQRIITKSTRIIFGLAFPVALVFIIGGKFLITLLFGPNYQDSYIPLLFLCIGQLVNALTGSVGLVLSMTGNQVYFVKTTSFMALLNILLSVPLVIYFDVNGAAALYSLILILQNLILISYVRSKLNINTTILKTNYNLK